MERIGIAASKIAKGNILLYNFYVVLISFLFSLFIFTLAGMTVFFALIVISYISLEVAQLDIHGRNILKLCLISLTVVVAIFNIFAISKNIKFTKKSFSSDKDHTS